VLHVIYVLMSMIRYVHDGAHVDPEMINTLLESLYNTNRENMRLKREIEKRPRSKHTSSGSSYKKKDPIVGYVCANDEFYGLTVYENSNGRYVNDNGTRVNANRFKVSPTKPK
jgi:hypothetical protein